MMHQELVRMDLERVLFLGHEIQYRSLCGKPEMPHDTLSLMRFQMRAPQSFSAGPGCAPAVGSRCATHASKH